MLRRAAALLLAAAALPTTPLLAQDAQPAPVVIAPPPPPITAPVAAPAPVSAPIVATPAPISVAPVVTPVVAEPVATRPAPIRTVTRSPVRTVRAAPVAEPAPAPIAALPEPAPAPLPVAEAPIAAPEPAPAPVAESPVPAEPAPVARSGGSILPWLVGLAVIAGLAALPLRRRRRTADEVYYETDELPADEPELIAVPLAAEPLADAGVPALELAMHPVRAGVDADEARVEFELVLDNHGSAPARDVEIKTWMIPAGSQTEMESMLVDRADSSVTDVDAGETQRFESTVSLPTSGIADDAVLPVVVAEARYRLSDGTEQLTHASFAVGVPIDGELARFDIENPSGMHEDVEARTLETV